MVFINISFIIIENSWPQFNAKVVVGVYFNISPHFYTTINSDFSCLSFLMNPHVVFRSF